MNAPVIESDPSPTAAPGGSAQVFLFLDWLNTNEMQTLLKGLMFKKFTRVLRSWR
jgi:hypothetical protein